MSFPAVFSVTHYQNENAWLCVTFFSGGLCGIHTFFLLAAGCELLNADQNKNSQTEEQKFEPDCVCVCVCVCFETVPGMCVLKLKLECVC